MSEKKSALGRGLGSLIPMSFTANKSEESGQSVQIDGFSKNYFECNIDDIIPNPNQPRKIFTNENLEELANSIRENGFIQPLVVRPMANGKYELIAGERRLRASKLIGLAVVPVILKETTEKQMYELALIENIQRQDLNVIEEALAYKELLSRYQLTQEELAKQLGKDRTSIANSLRLLKLPDRIRDELVANKISMGHARALLGVENRELQLQITEDIIAHNLSVRDVENLVRDAKVTVDSLNPPTLEPKAPKADYSSLTKRLEEHLRQKVSIKAKENGGEIIIKYSSESDLNDLVDKLFQ